MKKIIIWTLAICIVLSLTVLVFASEYSAWAKESIEKAEKLNILEPDTDFRKAITREGFCELVYNYIALVGGDTTVSSSRVFDDTDNVKVEGLSSLGIIKGKAESLFAPDDLLTREEAAVILFRMINTVHPDWVSTELYYMFDDESKISDWAMESVQRLCNMGIMKGIGGGKFSPKGKFTAEQAVTAVIRIYNAFRLQMPDNEWSGFTFADKLDANMPEDRNYMFSPFSIKMALMMAANGATGTTLEEILSATGIDDLESYNENAREMLEAYSESDLLRLNVSNSIWINSDKTEQRFSNSYKSTLKKAFGATADIVTDKNAVRKINGWVNEKTAGKIPTIITEENKDFWAMLINAVYFKGRWEDEFHKAATKKDVFTSRDGSLTEADFMNKRDWMSYAECEGVSVVELPYLTREDVFDKNGEYIETKILDGVDISMYLMMSDKGFNPEAVLNRAEMSSAYIALSVPKFSVEYSVGLNDVLKTIGIKKAFEEDAEFDKMFNSGSMLMDSVIHKTYIKVDEEGTEAAAVTAIAMAGSALPPEPIELKFNKPFTFVIRDNANGEILFMGEYAFVNK